MKRRAFSPALPLRLLLAGGGGLLLAFAFPPFELWWLAWCGFLPVLFAVGDDPKRGFLLGGLAGLAFHAFLLSWLFSVAGPFYLILAAYLAFFWALFFWLLVCLPARGRVFFGLACWCLTEYVARHLFTGFPWLPLALSQTGSNAAVPRTMLMLASVLGSLGVSGAVILANLTLFYGFRRAHRVSLGAVAALAGFLLLAVMIADRQQPSVISKLGAISFSRSLLAVQPGISSYEGLTPDETLRRLADQTEGLVAQADAEARALFNAMPPHERTVALTVWPESSFSNYFLEFPEAVEPARAAAAKTSGGLILGALHRTPAGSYNAVFLVRENGAIEVYRKRHLVPYGEWLPGKNILLIRRLYRSIAGYTPFLIPGGRQRPFRVVGAGIGPLVCFENIFPELSRDMARRGADLLVVISNFSWYRSTMAMRQHFSHNILRAAETGLAVVQAATTGITGEVSVSRGRLTARIVATRGGAGCLNTPFPRTGHRATPYATAGDLPVILLCVLLTGVLLCRP